MVCLRKSITDEGKSKYKGLVVAKHLGQLRKKKEVARVELAIPDALGECRLDNRLSL